MHAHHLLSKPLGTYDSAARPLSLRGWRDPSIIAVALVALGAGYGQFGAVAALGSVAKILGHTSSHTASIAEQAGLTGTALGIGLAIIRLASLLGLPLAGLADRFGRRPVLITTTAIGLALTAVAALSPSYWSFVAIFACGRPFLSATNAVAQVNVAEQTSSKDRSKAVALTAAGYGVGAGITAIIHGFGQGNLGFRLLFASALVPLALLFPVSRRVTETDRYAQEAALVDAGAEHELPVLGVIATRLRRRLAFVALITFFIAVVSGPATSFVFLYAQNIEHQPGWVTALMVVAAGVAGLGGLLLGRLLADQLGRRVTSAAGVIGLSLFGALCYSGSRAALLIGYVLGVMAGSVLAPALGSLANELFPTSVRASVAGWLVVASVLGASVGLVVFGALVQAGNGFEVAAAATFLPVVLTTSLFAALPETRGLEPEALSSL